jgi:hypothetical protein
VTIPTGYLHVVAVYIVVQAGSRNEVEPGKRRSAAHKRLSSQLQDFRRRAVIVTFDRNTSAYRLEQVGCIRIEQEPR